MLHKYSDIEKYHNDLLMAFKAKDQECMTLKSHTEIQNQQITTLQTEISQMIDRLEDIKVTYEQELAQRDNMV